ncbi:MAG TPA: hypothetical protein VMR33_08540 [Candidatus Baltobacteraceae bacterium]|jgi:hypothetical protein|nr:hypothetical protein [Candidatus Baltobacteraceae bacterium]
MSQYAALYQNAGDQVVAWLLVALWILFACGVRKRLPESVPSEEYLVAASRALFLLCLAVGGIFLVGLVFLAWLKISSGFWFVWELFFLMSVITAFWVAPVLAVFFLGWALVARKRFRHSPRPLRMASLSLAGVVADVLLYYAFAGSIG